VRVKIFFLLLLLLRGVCALNISAPAGGIFLCATPCGSANGTALVPAATSKLNALLSNALAAQPPLLPASSFVLLNANASPGALHFLHVSGSWEADAPLSLPTQLIAVLADGALLRATRALEAQSPPFSPVVVANFSSNAALVAPGGVAGGATISCGGYDVRGALALQAPNFAIDGVTFTECGGLSPDNCTSAIHFYGRPFAAGGEVAGCRVAGGCRAIWLQTHKRVFLHHTQIENARKHTVDFDSFSRDSVVWANNISGSAQEAVFIEQGAENIFVAGNPFFQTLSELACTTTCFPPLRKTSLSWATPSVAPRATL
jgi:hypothetical protein